MKMTELISGIRSFLLTKATRVYFRKAPSTAAFPYVVFDLPSSYSSRPSEDFSLEVDVWDDKQDTTALENLTESIDGNGDIFSPTGLNYKTITSANLTATSYREARLIVPDDDERINRRQLRYTVRAY